MIQQGDLVSWHAPLFGYYRDIPRPTGRVVLLEGDWAVIHAPSVDRTIVPFVFKHVRDLIPEAQIVSLSEARDEQERSYG